VYTLFFVVVTEGCFFIVGTETPLRN